MYTGSTSSSRQKNRFCDFVTRLSAEAMADFSLRSFGNIFWVFAYLFFLFKVPSSILFIFFRVICINNMYARVFYMRSKMNKFEYFGHHFWFVNFARLSLCVIVPPFGQSFDHRRIVNCNRNKEEVESWILDLMLTYYRPPCTLHVLVYF